MQRRVARAVCRWSRTQRDGRPVFLDARIRGAVTGGNALNSSAGTARESTWIAAPRNRWPDATCADDQEGRPGIYVALQEATETMRRGGGVGYDFSRLRPRGAFVATTQSEASGPVRHARFRSFVRDGRIGRCSPRRTNGILRIDHPDVLEFVREGNAASW